MHSKDIQELIKLLENSDLAELEIEEEGRRIRLVRNYINPQAGMTPLIVSHRNAPVAAESSTAKPQETPEKGLVVTSPFVGTFYRAPSPTAAPFVDIGSQVSKGQILCIVEAMKLMNEIESDYNGRITQIYVESGQPVEYGDKLFLIEP